jgi:hypothetical protein
MNRCVIALNSSSTNDSITTRYGAASIMEMQILELVLVLLFFMIYLLQKQRK